MTTADPQRRLADVVRRERQRRGLTQREAADLAGISFGAWRRVERGEPSRDLTLAGVERAFGWVAGSCAAVLAGGEPATLASGDGSDVLMAPGGPLATFTTAFGRVPPERREHVARLVLDLVTAFAEDPQEEIAD